RGRAHAGDRVAARVDRALPGVERLVRRARRGAAPCGRARRSCRGLHPRGRDRRADPGTQRLVSTVSDEASPPGGGLAVTVARRPRRRQSRSACGSDIVAAMRRTVLLIPLLALACTNDSATDEDSTYDP